MTNSSHGFHIGTVQQWLHQPRVLVGQPQKWGAFSYDSERRMHLDERSSKKFRNPFTPTASDRYPKEIDLNYGFEKYIPSYLAPDRLDALLEVLRSRGDEDKNLAAQLEANQLLTFRGIMTKICTMLYDDREGFDFNAQLFDGTLYLEQYCSEEKYAFQVRDMENFTRRKNTYQGYSFESYCTVEADKRLSPNRREREMSPGRSPAAGPPHGWSGDVNTHEQWCLLMRSRLGDTRMIIGGEVDCVDHRNELVELKTTMDLRSQRDKMFFEKKLVRFYFQSFLLGVPHIYVGFKSRSGIVQTGEMFNTLELPRLVRGKSHAWDPQACLNSASAFVKYARDKLAQDQREGHFVKGGESARAGRVFRLTRSSGSPVVELFPLADDEVQRMNYEAERRQPSADGEEPKRVGILPMWYVEWVRSRRNKT